MKKLLLRALALLFLFNTYNSFSQDSVDSYDVKSGCRKFTIDAIKLMCKPEGVEASLNTYVKNDVLFFEMEMPINISNADFKSNTDLSKILDRKSRDVIYTQSEKMKNAGLFKNLAENGCECKDILFVVTYSTTDYVKLDYMYRLDVSKAFAMVYYFNKTDFNNLLRYDNR